MTVLGDAPAAIEIPVPGGRRSIGLTWGVGTDVGRRRPVNEDSMLAAPPIFSVADGMGGHAAGDLASAAAVTRLAEHVRGDYGDRDQIERALWAATEDIDELAEGILIGAGTTVTGVVLTLTELGPAFLVFNVGDSRVYSFEKNELRRVTHDHSVVQELVDAGELTEAQADVHPESNVITRALGFHETPQPDFTELPVRAGMRLLVCSDGLTKEVEQEHIRMHMAAGLSSQVTASALIDAALASGGHDNVTVIVVDVVAAPPVLGRNADAPRSGAAAV